MWQKKKEKIVQIKLLGYHVAKTNCAKTLDLGENLYSKKQIYAVR